MAKDNSTMLTGVLWEQELLVGNNEGKKERKCFQKGEGTCCSTQPSHGNVTACALSEHGFFFWGRKYKCVSSHLMLWGEEKAHRLPCSVSKNTALAFRALCYINTRSIDILISLLLRAERSSNLKCHPLPFLSPI